MAFCATTRTTTTTTAAARRRRCRRQGRREGGARGCCSSQGLYGYLNTFAINSRERALEARSRRAMRRSFSPFSYSRFVLALSPLASCLYLYSSGVSRLSAGSRLVSAARVLEEKGVAWQPAFEKRDLLNDGGDREQQTATRKERGAEETKRR